MIFVLYASNRISPQDRYENEYVEDGKGSQGQTDSHEDTDCVIESIEDWQTNRGKERGYGHGNFELVRYVYHVTGIVSATKRGVNHSGKEP